MASVKAQRICIWIIVIALAAGTMLSFFAIILGNKNTATEQATINQLTQKYQADVAAQTKQLSDQYYPILSQHTSEVSSFDAASITEVKSNNLKSGDGTAITENSMYTAYYIGWNPSGKIFDSSIANGALKAPFSVKPGGVISGWTKGTSGMQVNGIREIEMPSADAYGTTGSGADIPANTPLKFIVMVIPTPKTVVIPQALLDYYKKQGY